jgi:tellurite resistance protein
MQPATPPSVKAFDQPKLEALIELMYLAAYADGEFGAEERAHFVQSIQSLTDRSISETSLDELLSHIATQLKETGREARLAALKEALGDPGACKAALALAIQVTLADGIIRTTEREILFDISEGLGIDRSVTADLVSALSSS